MLTNRFQPVTAPSRALSSLVSPLECLFLAIMAGNASCLNAWVVALLLEKNQLMRRFYYLDGNQVTSCIFFPFWLMVIGIWLVFNLFLWIKLIDSLEVGGLKLPN
ncbi:hypothetical protein I3760_13G150100 [Carya illinoinensis]|nr:hypothetical protein I3760_13G150100 [Carya illinoinensis]